MAAITELGWRLWCRLCAKNDSQNVNIFFKNEDIVILTTVLQKYFNVEINREDELPQMLCTECFSIVTSHNNFIERVEKVQMMYNDLKQSAVWDPHQIRAKYGLLDEERLQPLPEAHFLEAKINTGEICEADLEFLENANNRVKKEAENILQTDEADTFEYEDGDEEVEDPFGADIGVIGSDEGEGEDEENTNLATLRIALNTKCKSSTDQLPRLLRRSRKRKENLENKLSSEDLEKFEGKSFIYECSECPKQFKRIQNYRIHMQLKHNSTPSIPQVSCNHCSRVFNTQNQLERHARMHLPLEMKRDIPCPYCDKKFTTKYFVTTHIKFVHMDEREFICEECGNAVRTSAALQEHMLTHTDYAPFECDVCHKGFKNKARLKRHMQIHDQNKHICTECGLQLNSRTTLNRHFLVHSDKLQHKCDYCGRAFKRVKSLKNHLILHTGLKPYSCDFCDLTFANGSNCRTHKKKAHPKELAELEASGCRAYTKNIPRIEALRAVTKAADNLAPVVSKQSGNFAFGKKPKLLPSDTGTVRKKPTKGVKRLEVKSNALVHLSSDLSNEANLYLQTLPPAGFVAQRTGSSLAVNNNASIVDRDVCDEKNVIPAIDKIYSNLQGNLNTVTNIVDKDTWQYPANQEANNQ